MQVVSGTLTTEYLYNGDGVRIAQIANGLRTDYVQDIAAPLPQVLTARQGGTVNNYLRGLGLIAEQQGSAAWQYHLPDALGSVRQVTDPLAQVTLSQQYDPFGGLLASTGATRSAYGFAGEDLYLRARTYNPATGRFLQQDSVVGSPTQPRTLHRYAYAFNNPLNYRDPSGHTGESVNTRTPGPQTNYRNRQVGSSWAGGLNVAQNTPDRSVNTVRQSHPTYSDPYARRQSQGHRSALCSLWGIHDVAAGVFADVEKTIRDPQAAAKRLALQAGANWQRSSAELRDPNTWTAAYWQRAWNDVRSGVSLGLDLVPVIGDIKGGIEGLIGYDLAGRKLSQFEQTLTMVGALVGIFTIADELVDAGKLVRHIANDADFAGDMVRAGRGLGHLDEGNGLRRALAGGAESSGLNKKIRAARAWSDAGADLSDPSVRGMIRRGRGPVTGGSGKSDIYLPGGRRHTVPAPELGSQRHNYILEGTVYPPERFGVTPEMERAFMKSFPPDEDRLLGLRDRPLGAASLDSTIGLDAKTGWVRDWAVLQKHDRGVRELIDANKLIRGEYGHVTRGQNGWIFKIKNKDVFVPDDEFLPFVDNSVRRMGQEIHQNTYASSKLIGQNTLSDVDGAFYATIDVNGNWIDLGDAYYKEEFMEEFNINYTVGGVSLPPRQHIISHGVFSDIPGEMLKKLSIIPNRVEAMLAEQTLIYAHLPSQNIYGFYDVVPFEEVVNRLKIEKFAKYR